MDKPIPTTSYDMAQLDEDTGRLMAATAEAFGEKVAVAQQRLAAVLDSAKEIAGCVRDKAMEGVKSADGTIHKHPYQAIGIAFTASMLIGFFVARKCLDKRD